MNVIVWWDYKYLVSLMMRKKSSIIKRILVDYVILVWFVSNLIIWSG